MPRKSNGPKPRACSKLQLKLTRADFQNQQNLRSIQNADPKLMEYVTDGDHQYVGRPWKEDLLGTHSQNLPAIADTAYLTLENK